MLGLGLSLLTGGSVSPEYVKLSKAFVTRVEADGGTVDSFACLKTDMAYLTSNPDAPAGYVVEFSAATVGSSAEFRITLTGGAGYTYTYAVTDTQANEVTGTGVMSGNIQSVTADLSTLVDGTVTVAVYLSGAGGDGLIVTDTATLVGYTGLLDTYSGAAAAYSLRLLDTSYTGNAIKVRRSSDNAEQDIAFVNNELDTASLETFASGTDAFVTTWYDQSGNGNNATQTTAAGQPKIVSNGTSLGYIETTQGQSTQLETSQNVYVINTDYSVFFTAQNFGGEVFGSAGSGFFAVALSGSTSTSSNSFSNPSYYQNGSAIGITWGDMYNATTSFSQISALVARTAGDTTFRIGFSTGTFNHGRYKEYIIYPNQTISRTGVENNIITHYGF